MNEEKFYGVQFLTISNKYVGQRVDNFLIRQFPNIPKSRIYQMLRKGEVRRNKKRIQASDKLAADDILRIPPLYQKIREEKAVPLFWLEIIKNSVIYEDEQFLILNKPNGIAVHAGSANNYGVIDAVETLWGKEYAELAHRIDRETSGILVLGKTRAALLSFQNQLRDGTAEKHYLCLVNGNFPSQEVRINVQKIQAEDGDRMIVNTNGKEALTYFKNIQQFQNASLLDAHIKTGRTHQIRLSIQHRNHAIVGDDKYGNREFNKKIKKLGYKDMFLHAHRLAFDLENNTRLALVAPLPQAAQQLLAQLEITN